MRLNSIIALLLLGCVGIFLTLVECAPPPSVLKIGAILPLTGPLAGAGHRAWQIMNLSLAELQSTLPGILPGRSLELVVVDGGHTMRTNTLATLALDQLGVHGIIAGSEGMNQVSASKNLTTSVNGVGTGTGTAMLSAAIWAANSLVEPLNMLAISSSACSSLAYNDGVLYPNLVRMCGKQTSKARAILATFAAFGWNRVAVFSQDGNDGFGENDLAEKDPGANSLGLGQSEADFFIYELSQLTSVEQTLANTLRLRVPAMTSLAREQIPERLQQLKQSGIRIILIFIQGELLSYTMRLASSLGMLKDPYVWVGAGSYSGPESSDGLGDGSVPSGGPGMGLCSSALRRQLADITPSVPSVDSSAGKLISTYQSSTIGATSSAATYVYQADLAFTSNPLLGAICFTPAKPRTPAFVNMKYRLKAGGLDFESMLNADDAAAYDSILVYAKTFDALITSGASVSATGRWAGSDVYTTMTQVRLLTEGMTQNIMFDVNGDRLGQIDIYNYDPYGAQAGAFVRRGYWDGFSGNLTISDAFIWPDGTFDLPQDYENAFDVGQSITYTKDTSIMALAYFFVLLPSLVLTYNVRKLMKDFIVSIGRDQDWLIDAGRAFVLFSMPGFFAMIYLNLLALTFETGDFMVTQPVFVGGTFFVIVATLFIMPAPILLETYLKARKGSQQVDELMEDFECLFVNGEEVTPAGEATKKEVAKEAKQSRRAKARAARAKAKAGKLIKDDSDGFVERELWNIYDKTTIGMLLTSAIFSAIFIVLMRITLEGLILPVNVKADGGRLFGVWILVLALAHCFLTVIFKDSRNTARLVSAFGLSVTLFAGFHSALSCVTFEYTGVDRYVGEASIDNGGIAIAHAILFAIPFFIGLLQLIKALKLSRHSLDAVLNNMKSKLASLETSLETAKADRKVAAQDADHLKRLLELSNLCRPLHRNHALAFTMADTVTETANGGANKIFVPASLQQEAARTPGQAVKSIGTPNGSVGPSTPVIAPSSPAAGRRGQPGLPIPSAGMTSSAASNITGLDFGFLARPKAEMTGYKLLNELSLELFLASGPVHHRAVADIHLSHILSHPLTIEIFKDSLTRSGSQESLALWLDIQRFKQLSDDHLRRQIAEQMVQTFIYSDAPHPINYLKPASRESALNVIFSKKAVKPNTFHFIEQELVARLEKDFANFATSTGFKVCAFLLGHSSYRPSTRIKTLNPGGAVVGDGGKLVQITQVNQHNVLSSGMPGEPSGSGIAGAPTGIGGAGAGGPGANDDPQSSLATGAAHSAFRHEMSKGPSVIGVPRPGGANNSGGMQKSPAATNPMRRVTIENAMHKAGPSTPAGSSTGQAEPKTPSGQPAALNLDISIQPQFARGLSVPLNEHQDDELEEDDNDADNDKDSENTPLAPSAASP